MKHKVFIVWFVIFLIWAFYRAYFFLPDWADEFLVKPLIFVLPVLIVVFKEKKKLTDLGITFRIPKLFVDLYIGVVIGILFAVEGLVVNYLKYNHFSFAPILASRVSGGVGMFILLNLATSVSEEILGRGFLYKRLFQTTNNQFGSAFTSSFLFLLLHIPILFTRLHLSGTSLLVYPVSIMLLGITNSYIFTLRGSLMLPVLIHTFWNMTVALYL